MAVVGANGSGKSTLLNICAGVVRATSGTVERSPRVGYAPQQDGVSPLFTEQVLTWREAGAGVLVVTHLLHDVDRVDHVLELPRAEGES